MADYQREGQSSASNMAAKVSDAASKVAETVKNTDFDDAARVAQQGGRYAYDTVAAHPLMAFALSAIGAYLLFGPSDRSSYTRARDSARDYANRASRTLEKDFSSSKDTALEQGRDYAYRLGNQASREPLATAVGLALLSWMAVSILSSSDKR